MKPWMKLILVLLAGMCIADGLVFLLLHYFPDASFASKVSISGLIGISVGILFIPILDKIV